MRKCIAPTVTKLEKAPKIQMFRIQWNLIKKLFYPRLSNSQLGIGNQFFVWRVWRGCTLAQCYAPCRLFTIMILYWTSAHRIIVNYIKISSLHPTATMIMDFESDFSTYKPCDSLESIVSNFSVHYYLWIITVTRNK